MGGRIVKSYSRQQEAELHAAMAASAETLGLIKLCADMGIVIGGEVFADSSAAIGIAQRTGMGKVRHLKVQALWVQEVRSTGRLSYKKVLGSRNPADILTKHVPGDLLDTHARTLGVEFRGGRELAAPTINSLEVTAQDVHEWVEFLEKRVCFAGKVRCRGIAREGKSIPVPHKMKGCRVREMLSDKWQKNIGNERWADMDSDDEENETVQVDSFEVEALSGDQGGCGDFVPVFPLELVAVLPDLRVSGRSKARTQTIDAPITSARSVCGRDSCAVDFCRLGKLGSILSTSNCELNRHNGRHFNRLCPHFPADRGTLRHLEGSSACQLASGTCSEGGALNRAPWSTIIIGGFGGCVIRVNRLSPIRLQQLPFRPSPAWLCLCVQKSAQAAGAILRT